MPREPFWSPPRGHASADADAIRLAARSRGGRLSAGLGLCLLVGCATPPREQTERLGLAVPDRYTATADRSPLREQGWLADFDDPGLIALVQESLANNYNVQATAARLDAAGATQRITASSRYPRVSGDLGASTGETTFDLGNGRVGSEWVDRYSAGLGLVWEVDLWGKIKNRAQAALADFQAVEADYRAAELSLAAGTVKAWFNAVEAQSQLELARETLGSFQNNLNVIERGYKRGIVRALDVRLTRANVEAARSNVELRERLRQQAARALEVILGRYPANEVALSGDLPSLNNDVPPGLPSELLRRRPDLRAAERRFAAALERVKVSKKELLPTIGLTASADSGTAELQDLLDLERLAWRIGGNLAQPLFQGGRLIAGIDRSKAESAAALAEFSQSVLVAFREVETFLADEVYLERQEQALRKAATESVAAEDLAWQEYERGLAEIITVLESERRAFNSRSSLINIVNGRLQNRVNLYLALGGGFRVSEATSQEGDGGSLESGLSDGRRRGRHDLRTATGIRSPRQPMERKGRSIHSARSPKAQHSASNLLALRHPRGSMSANTDSRAPNETMAARQFAAAGRMEPME